MDLAWFTQCLKWKFSPTSFPPLLLHPRYAMVACLVSLSLRSLTISSFSPLSHLHNLILEVFLDFSPYERASRSKAANTSREAPRKKNLWLPWTIISLSRRRQGQDLTLRLGMVDIFTNTQFNMLGSFDWQYRGDGRDICHYTFLGKFCLSLPGKKVVCKILQFSVYTRSRFALFDMD